MESEIKDNEVNTLFDLILRLRDGIEESNQLREVPAIKVALTVNSADCQYIDGTVMAAKGALSGINKGVESIHLEVTKTTKEWSRAWAMTNKEPLSLRVEDLEACHRSLLLAIRRMKSWIGSDIKDAGQPAGDSEHKILPSSSSQEATVEHTDDVSLVGVDESDASKSVTTLNIDSSPRPQARSLSELTSSEDFKTGKVTPNTTDLLDPAQIHWQPQSSTTSSVNANPQPQLKEDLVSNPEKTEASTHNRASTSLLNPTGSQERLIAPSNDLEELKAQGVIASPKARNELAPNWPNTSSISLEAVYESPDALVADRERSSWGPNTRRMMKKQRHHPIKSPAFNVASEEANKSSEQSVEAKKGTELKASSSRSPIELPTETKIPELESKVEGTLSSEDGFSNQIISSNPRISRKRTISAPQIVEPPSPSLATIKNSSRRQNANWSMQNILSNPAWKTTTLDDPLPRPLISPWISQSSGDGSTTTLFPIRSTSSLPSPVRNTDYYIPGANGAQELDTITSRLSDIPMTGSTEALTSEHVTLIDGSDSLKIVVESESLQPELIKTASQPYPVTSEKFLADSAPSKASVERMRRRNLYKLLSEE
jgi:hypothetical protein